MSLVDTAVEWITARRRAEYGLAVTRIVLGIVVWTQLVVNWSDRHYTWGDGAAWTDPVRAAKEWPSFLGIFQQVHGWGFDAVYVATIVAGILLMLGVYTRASSILTLFLWVSLYVSNPFVGSGGDAVLRMVLLYLCFTDAGRHWSIDERLRERRGEVRPWVPVWLTTAVHNVAVVLIIHQVVMVYVASAFWKLQSDTWTSGRAVYYPLQTQAYSPWGDLIHPFSSAAPIIAGATWSAIAIQLFFPVLLLYRPTRALALVVITGMHLGIGIFMGILYFSLVMIAVDMMLISDASWKRGLHWLERQRERLFRGRNTRSGGSLNDSTERHAPGGA